MTRTRRRWLAAGLAGVLVSALAALPMVSSASAKEAASTRISFMAPIDFATGAVPSSAAFNAAEGDQVALELINKSISDSVAVGDFNRDGKPDAAQTNVVSGTVSVFLGNGPAGFAPPRLHPVGVHPNFVVAGDLDLDGDLDLAVANSGSNNLAILGGNGDGTFQPAWFVPVPDPRNVAIGEFNGDDIPDLAAASAGPSAGPTTGLAPVGGVAVLTGIADVEGNPTATFAPTQFITHTHSADNRPVSANYVAVGDFDGSGFDDLAVGVGISRTAGEQQAGTTKLTGDDLLIFLNRNQSLQQPFNTAPDQPAVRVGGRPSAIAVADFNGDTHPDLAVLGSFSAAITTLLGDSDGHFVVRATNATVGLTPRALAVGDFNDDGIHDLVVANFAASTVAVLQGNGDGTFQPADDFWTGDLPTGVAVGHFNDDERLDVVAARTRTDQLSLLLNDSPKRGDGVVIIRDIPYGSPTHPTNDPYAAHHKLDVYVPPKGTPCFAGKGTYPVVFFAHGGGGLTGDKTSVSYLMRSLALEGIVGVSTDYRLGTGDDGGVKDVAQAFRWTRDNIGSSEYGGDPGNMFLSGQSAGAGAAKSIGTDGGYVAEQKSVRALVMVGSGDSQPGNTPTLPPSLLINGDEGLERALAPLQAKFSADAKSRGAESEHVIVNGRDHLTIVANLAVAGDRGRVALLSLVRKHMTDAGDRAPGQPNAACRNATGAAPSEVVRAAREQRLPEVL